MEIMYGELLDRFIRDNGGLFDGFSRDEVDEILKEPFKFVKERMNECYAGPIRLLHLGQFRVIEKWRQKLEEDGKRLECSEGEGH